MNNETELTKEFQKEAMELQRIFHRQYGTYWEETEAIRQWLVEQDKTKESVKGCTLLNDILNEQEEIINCPCRFNGVHIVRIKRIFAEHGIIDVG